MICSGCLDLGMIGSTTAAWHRTPVSVASFPTAASHAAPTQKDMLPALEMGRRMDVLLPTAAVGAAISDSSRGINQIHEDFAVLFQVLAHMSGLTQ